MAGGEVQAVTLGMVVTEASRCFRAANSTQLGGATYGYNCTIDDVRTTAATRNAVSNTFVYILFTICVYGVVGNVLSFVALGRDKTKRDITILLLKVLAVGDTINLMARIQEAILFIVRHVCSQESAGILILDMFAFVCVDIAQTLATWLVLPVTLERYVFICHPLHAERFTSKTRTKCFVGLVIGFVVAFNIPNILYHVYAGMKYYPIGEHRNSSSYAYLQTLAESRFMYIYWHYIKTLVAVALPLLLLVILNVKLMYSLHMSARRLAHVTGSPGERGVAKILITIVTTLLLCQGPSAVIQALDLAGIIKPIAIMQPVGATLLVLNSACNFVIYCAFGPRFRRVLLDMLRCKKADRDDWSSVTFV